MIAELVDQELEPTLARLERLVREPSIEGSAAITRCLDLIEDDLAPLAGRVRRPEFEGLPSLVCEWGDPADERRLLLAGHADVVPADGAWSTPPFSLARHGDALTGRGVCDMKGALAAFVGALKVVSHHSGLDGAPVSLVVTGDEEVGSPRGMIPLLREREVAGAWAVCGEPTSLDVFTGNRGVIWLRITIRGRGGHAGLAHVLDNPLPIAARLLGALESLPLTVRDERFDPSTPSLTATWLQVEGEPVVNIVPDAVSIGVDRRLLPGESPDAAIAQIEEAVASCVAAPFDAQVTVDWVCPPYIASVTDPFVGAAQEVVREVGRAGSLGTDSAADDSSWLGNAGISTVLCGPGEPEQAHTTDETVAVSEVRDAIEVYARLALAARDGRIPKGNELR
jgi:acetylornithine deacetylase/succinyl-diaminopimelate desuccinylase-like protein